MDKTIEPRYCAWVKGQDIERQSLTAAFGKFGKITKIFVNQESTLGKVYFENYSDLRKACVEIRRSNWTIDYRKDVFKGKSNPDNFNSSRQEHFTDRRHQEHFNSNFVEPSASFNGSTSSLNKPQNWQNTGGNSKVQELDLSSMGETDCEEFSISYDFVDSAGRSVEILENEEKEFYVNLKDVRRNGFQIFRKDDYENAIITRIEDLREFEAFLLNQAYKYLLDHKRSFTEDEVLNCIEKVKSRLWGTKDAKDTGRIITPTSTNNIQITTSAPATSATNHQPGASGDGFRAPKQLPDNFKPCFSRIKPAPKRNIGRKPQFPNHNAERTDNKGIGFRSAEDQHSLRKPRLNGVAKKEEEEEHWEDDQESKSVKPDVRPSKPEPVIEESRPRKNNRTSETASVASGAGELAKLSIERVSCPVSSTPYKVLVSYIQDRPEKGKLYYVQPVENMPVVEQLLVNVNSLAAEQKDVTPVREGLYLVQFIGVWYRCLVIHANHPDPSYVELVDYGNKEKLAGPFRELPEDLEKVPAQSLRVKLDKSYKVDWEVDSEVDILVKKLYDDGTHLVEPAPPGFSSSRPVNPIAQEQPKPVAAKPLPKEEPKVEQRYFNLPAAFGTIKQGDQVKILGYAGEKLVLMSKECIAHRKSITQYIQEMSHAPLDKVEVNQLVLCSHESRPLLHRAIVTKLDGNVATVQYLDFAGEEAQLSVKSLRNVDANLSKKPRAILETAVFPALKTLSPKAEEYLSEVINKGTKLVVGENQNLLFDGNQSLFEKIKSLDASSPPAKSIETPAPPKKLEAPLASAKPQPANIVSKKAEPIWFSDMPYYAVKPDESSFFAFCCQDSQTITLISTSEESIEYMAKIEITPDNNEPYRPEELEMCLVLFEDSWYRATVLAVTDDAYDMLCVDFGNQCTVGHKDIRQFVKEFADIPIIGLSAFFGDLPEGNLKVDAKLQELIPDQTALNDVIVVSVPDNVETVQYQIKVPSITKKLKDAGLL